jgi:hypothetical protein
MAVLNVKSMPDDLYERLKRRAAQRRRSISKEVLAILEQALEEDVELSLMDLQGLGGEAWDGVDGAEHVAVERDAWD